MNADIEIVEATSEIIRTKGSLNLLLAVDRLMDLPEQQRHEALMSISMKVNT